MAHESSTDRPGPSAPVHNREYLPLRSAWFRTLGPVLFVTAAVIVRVTLGSVLGARAPFVTFYPAVALAALLGGLRGGLLATLLCAALSVVWREPLGPPILQDPADWLGLGVFLASCVLICGIAEAMHRARARAAAAEAQARQSEERRRAETKIRHQNATLEGINRVFRESLACDTEEELGRVCLAVVEGLTESQLGFIGEINSQGLLDAIAVSGPGWKAGRTERMAGHPREFMGLRIAGIYGRVLRDGKALFTNDPSSHPDRVGTPEGHPPLTAFLGVPLTRGGETIGMVGVGNREGGYRPEHLDTIVALAPALVQVLMRQRGDQALRQSMARLRLALDAANAGTWEWDLRTGEFVWSDELWALFGLEPGACLPSHDAWLATVHTEDRAGVEQVIQDAVQRGVELNAEWRVGGASDTARWLMARGQPQRNGGEQVARYVGIVVDITARKRAEDALRESRKRLAAIVDSIADGFYVVDRQWRFTYINDAGLGFFGWTREQTLERSLHDMIPNFRGSSFEAEFRRAVDTGEPICLEAPSVATSRIVELHAYPGPDGLTVLFRDVTERHRIEAALLASEERLRLACEAAGLGVFEWHRSSDHSVWENQRMFEIFGHTHEDGTLGRDQFMAGYLHPADADALDRALVEGTKLARHFSTVCRIRRKSDGELRWVEIGGRFDLADDGTPLRLVGVIGDITDRKRAEDELKEADRQKDEFLATLAHELRNPLAPIRTGLDVLIRSDSQVETTGEVLAMMQRQIDQLVRLVDDLLDVSRITRGKIQLRSEPLDLAEVVAHAVETSQPLVAAGKHTLTTRLPPEPVRVKGDPLRLAQVFSNLLNNAAKFTPEGGRIGLTVETQGAQAVIRVSDEGLGIPPEMLPRVFDLFTQADHDLGPVRGGLGIGLTLVKRLVEMHGGTVEARSEGPGRGSEFAVRLPLLAPGAAPDTPIPVPTVLPDAARRILVVDDNRDAVRAITLLLKLWGHEVHTAPDGPSGLDAVAAFAPDVVLLDIGMPGMDGYEVARLIRQSPSLRDVWCVRKPG
jgi:PAS domain S-box-containing protein